MAVPTIDIHLAHPLDVARRRRAGERNVIVQEFLPGLRAGGLLASVQRSGGDVTGLPWHDDPLAAAIEQTEAVHAEVAESEGRLRLVLEPEDWPEGEDDPHGILLHLEGLAPIGESLPILDAFHRLGVRSAQLTWNARNAIASGVAVAGGDRGLTPFGRTVVERLNQLGIVIDLAHLAAEGVEEILAITSAPVVNTHANAAALCPHPRNISDDQMRAIVATGGLVGAVAYGEFIDPAQPTLERLIDHIEHMVEVVGVESVGVGSDFTDYAIDVVAAAAAGAGIYSAAYGFPEDFGTVSQFPALWEGLARRGYRAEHVEAIAGGNFRRVFAQVRAAAGGA
jgi:microsomal dipeptidase-like Zn-dependent dipeptidase